MDQQRFDRLTRALATTANRRSLLGSIGAVVSALVTTHAVEAAVKRRGGEICRKNGDCASNSCLPADSKGRQYCSCETGSIPCGGRCIPACTSLDSCHLPGACDPTRGACVNTVAPDGTPCSSQTIEDGVCKEGVCSLNCNPYETDVEGQCLCNYLEGLFDGRVCGPDTTCGPLSDLASACIATDGICTSQNGGSLCLSGTDCAACDQTTEGTPVCVVRAGSGCPNDTGCQSEDTCTTSADCPSGQVCIIRWDDGGRSCTFRTCHPLYEA